MKCRARLYGVPVRGALHERRGEHARPKRKKKNRFKMYTRKNSLRLKDFDYSAFGPYFITICTNKRQCFFDKEIIRKSIIETIQKIALELSVHIYTVIVADNHIHLIFHLSEVKTIQLSKFIGLMKVRITQYFKNEKGRACSPLRDMSLIWQRSYYDHIIRNEKDFLEKARYIENHPFKEDGDSFAEWH